MKAFPIIGVAVIAILIGSGLYYLEDKQSASVTASPSPVIPAPQKHTVSFRIIETGGNAAKVTSAKNYAAYTQAGLIRLWGLAHDTDGTTPPAVDFAKEYVVGVFAGQKPTGGYSVAVTGITDDGATRTIAVTFTKPGQGCITNQMVTSPYQIIAIPVSDAALAHADTENSVPCK